jgi:hypothetical protein
MSANIYWAPICTRHELLTWRPSSFLEILKDHFGGARNSFVITRDDRGFLESVKEEMGRDGGDHSEAEQILEALKLHPSVLIEIEA